MISRPDFEKKQILFVFTSQGEKISFSNDNVVVKDKNGKIKHQSTCYRLFLLFIIGETSITSGLIQRAKKFKYTIFLMNRNMKLYEVIGHRLEGNTLLHEKQYSYQGLEVGKRILVNKIDNQRRALLTIRNRAETVNKAADKLKLYSKRIQNETLELQELLGVEGLAARAYFRQIFGCFEWKGRQPRIKRDYLNATLDIGYTILFNIIDALLNTFGFDTYRGVLHREFYMRKSLVCDLIEPFRPLVDLQIRKSINLGQCKLDDFEKYGERYVLKWKESPKYISFLAKPFIDNKLAMFDYIQQYYRCVMRMKDIDEYPMFYI